MVQIGVLILGFTLFVMAFFTVATLIYVPKVLGEHAHDDEEADEHAT